VINPIFESFSDPAVLNVVVIETSHVQTKAGILKRFPELGRRAPEKVIGFGQEKSGNFGNKIL